MRGGGGTPPPHYCGCGSTTCRNFCRTRAPGSFEPVGLRPCRTCGISAAFASPARRSSAASRASLWSRITRGVSSRNVLQPWKALVPGGRAVLDQAGEAHGLTVVHHHPRLDGALEEGRRADAGCLRGRGIDVADLLRDVQGDLPAAIHARCDVGDDAGLEVVDRIDDRGIGRDRALSGLRQIGNQ